MIPWGYMYSFRRPWRASLRYRSLIAEVCLSLFSSLSISYHHWVLAPSLSLLRVPWSSRQPSWGIRMRYHCLSPDTFFFSVSLAFRKCTHYCLVSLCHSSTATANLLHQLSRVGCSSIHLDPPVLPQAKQAPVSMLINLQAPTFSHL